MYVVLLVGGDDGDAVELRLGLCVCRSLRLVVVAEDGGVVLGIEVVEPLAHVSLVGVARRRELRYPQSCLSRQS